MLSTYSFGCRNTHLKYAAIHIGAKRHTIYNLSNYKLHYKDHMVLPLVRFQYKILWSSMVVNVKSKCIYIS
jgi:hypothetical protein